MQSYDDYDIFNLKSNKSLSFTFDELIDKYCNDEKYRSKFAGVHKFKEHIVTHKLQKNSVVALFDKYTLYNGHMVEYLKEYLNAKHHYVPIQLIKSAYDPETDEFHPIITKQFLEYILRLQIDYYIYYTSHIMQLLKYPNHRSINDIYNEQILIKIFQMCDFNPNMVIFNNDILITEVANCEYFDFLKLLLDKGASLFCDNSKCDVPISKISPNGYLLLQKKDTSSYDPPKYNVNSHKFIIQYYKDKGDTHMISKLENSVPRVKEMVIN